MLIGEEAGGRERPSPAAVTLKRAISGRERPLPGAGVTSGFARFARPARFAGYIGVLAIIAVSLVPGEWRPSTGLAKEAEHAIAYLTVAVVLTIAGLVRWPRILGLVVLAAALEFGQLFSPHRHSSLTDFLVSSAGALLGYGLCSFVISLVSREYAWPALDHPAESSGPIRFKALAAIAGIAVAAASASISAAHGPAGWLGAGLALAMLAIAVVDGEHFLIPDPLNAAGMVLGLANSAMLGQGDPVAALAGGSLRAAVLCLLFFGLRLIYARRRGRQGIGLGDVKLAAVAGVWLDWSVMPIAVEIAALSALSVYALRRYVLRHPLRPSSRLPFGLYFAPAIWIGWLLQTTLMQGR